VSGGGLCAAGGGRLAQSIAQFARQAELPDLPGRRLQVALGERGIVIWCSRRAASILK